jgi:nucleoside-diphosphate-sugar epimerase
MSEHAVAITGANGYVGDTLRAAFAAAGYRVVALQRSAPTDTAVEHVPYSLQDGPAAPLPSDVRAVIHCAYDLRARSRAEIERINLGGTEKLLGAVGSVPVVLISSMSAYSGTQQIYGRTKLACEDLVAERGGTSLRLGLVHGSGDGGMIGALSKVAGLPLVPVLRPDSYQYAVHAEDMARCVVDATSRPRRGRPQPGAVQRHHPRAAGLDHHRPASSRAGELRIAVSRIACERGGRRSDRVPRRFAPRAHASGSGCPERQLLGTARDFAARIRAAGALLSGAARSQRRRGRGRPAGVSL